MESDSLPARIALPQEAAKLGPQTELSLVLK